MSWRWAELHLVFVTLFIKTWKEQTLSAAALNYMNKVQVWNFNLKLCLSPRVPTSCFCQVTSWGQTLLSGFVSSCLDNHPDAAGVMFVFRKIFVLCTGSDHVTWHTWLPPPACCSTIVLPSALCHWHVSFSHVLFINLMKTMSHLKHFYPESFSTLHQDGSLKSSLETRDSENAHILRILWRKQHEWTYERVSKNQRPSGRELNSEGFWEIRSVLTHVLLHDVVEDAALLEQVWQLLGVRPNVLTWNRN